MTIDNWKCIDPNEWCISDEVLYAMYGPQLSHFSLKNFWLRWDLKPGLPVEKPALYPLLYSQTWVNDHLRIATTCLQRPQFWGPNFNFHNTKQPLNNDHLSTTATNFGSQGWSLYTSLTVFAIKISKERTYSPIYQFYWSHYMRIRYMRANFFGSLSIY